MRMRFPFIVNQFVLVTLLTALIFGLVPVPSVYAASIVVTSNADTQAHDGRCTLREAIVAANNNAASGPVPGECVAGSTASPDTITFAADYTITLSGQLVAINSPMMIIGRGAPFTIIQAAANPSDANWRVFQVTPIGTLTLDGVTVRHGRCVGGCSQAGGIDPDSGGGIFNDGILTVTNSLIAQNTADVGAGITNWKTLTVINSTFDKNSALGGENSQGGGIHNDDTLTVTNSVFVGNTAVWAGGAIFSSWRAHITGSTFATNRVTGNSMNKGDGGGIYNVGLLNLTNSTLAHNAAPVGNGGAIYNFTPNLTVTNSTIASNDANIGDGIFTVDNVTFNNTIVANNVGPNCGGVPITNGSNNLDSGSSCGWGTSNGSLSNTNPFLGGLANNGGPTATMHLQAFSPAIDRGNASVCSASPVNGVDQRGVARPLGAVCDIGAYESQPGGGPDSVGVFRRTNGLLYLKHLNTTGFADLALNYGISRDYPVVADWDGDGDTTIGIYRCLEVCAFYIRDSNTIGFADQVLPFGQHGDQPIAGDWNGNGSETIGVFRPSSGQFFLRNSLGVGPAQIAFSLGIVGDVAIAGDWDGDGDDTVGVFRPSNGTLFLKNTNETGFADIALNYGIPGDHPIVGDWNGDGIDTIGVYRNGTFYLRNSNTIGFADIVFGLGIPGDHPIAGNWDGHP